MSRKVSTRMHERMKALREIRNRQKIENEKLSKNDKIKILEGQIKTYVYDLNNNFKGNIIMEQKLNYLEEQLRELKNE